MPIRTHVFSMNDEVRCYCRLRDRSWVVTGDLRGSQPVELGLAAPITPLVLDLSDLEIMDGAGAVVALNAVRALLAAAGTLRLVGAPQLLAHNLYRVGLLADTGPLVLEGVREEEPYG